MSEYGRKLVEAAANAAEEELLGLYHKEAVDGSRAALLAFLDALGSEGPTKAMHMRFAETYHRNDDEDMDVWKPDDFRHAFHSLVRALRTEIEAAHD